MQRPAAIGLRTDEIRTELWFDDRCPGGAGVTIPVALQPQDLCCSPEVQSWMSDQAVALGGGGGRTAPPLQQ